MNLDALDDAVSESKPRTSGISDVMELEMSLVYANPHQPRKHFDPDSLVELAESIKSHGLIQPISVVRRTAGYMIIAGERRWRAHQIIGSVTIKAALVVKDESEIEEMALIENIQRDDLTDYEIAMAVVRLWETGMYPQKKDLARAISKPLSFVSKAFSVVNKLDPEIRADIEENKRDTGLSVLEELSRVEPEKQREVYDRYNAGEIKRDEFKEAAKPKAEKPIEPKKIKVQREVAVTQGDGRLLFGGDDFHRFFREVEPWKKYKITIEEIV
ncbi:ParB/RepB/Spo0J family partition protein [Sulfuricurvum sp. IAE1]|uniref:ParB/RepB/Spo0J family partition protein n=1 Tax=Sulfuricurvum sp. IAE1 TaxID=2546102 RepID=UPI0010470716|nr:ParB/RepB/Spo0J family partition protein [Sulfuricurvum sp. IAE1]TDA64304.1 ParB/RepB/Spo0J family partition protein [Sulfuricurvum sp. IAE1]